LLVAADASIDAIALYLAACPLGERLWRVPQAEDSPIISE